MHPLDSFDNHIRLACWRPVPSGLSGARVWRSDHGHALKQWPPSVSLDRLLEIHRLQIQLQGIPFIPRLWPDRDSRTAIVCDGHVWDVSTWMPGEPWAGPWTNETIHAAVMSIAECHAAWAKHGIETRPAPVVERRMMVLQDAKNLTGVNSLAAEILRRIHPLIDNTVDRLRPWQAQPVTVQACWTDLRRDHVLFQGDHVSGIIDFGAVRTDSPACDLARLFDDDPHAFESALSAYETYRPNMMNHAMVRGIAATSTVCNLAGWALRLSRDPLVDDAVTMRVHTLLNRL